MTSLETSPEIDALPELTGAERIGIRAGRIPYLSAQWASKAIGGDAKLYAAPKRHPRFDDIRREDACAFLYRLGEEL